MTALERAQQINPDAYPDTIVKYGCPDRYGVGVKPDWCPYRGGKGGKGLQACKECWNRKALERGNQYETVSAKA